MTVITVCSSDTSYPPIAHSAADFATAAVASLTEKIMLFSNNNNNNNNNNNHPQTNKNNEENNNNNNNNNNNTSSMDTVHPMTNDWKDNGIDYDKTSMNETKSSLEMENKSMNDNNNNNQGQDDQTMDLSYNNNSNNSNNAINNVNNNNNNNNTNNSNSVSPICRSLPSSPSPSRIPLQIVFDMDETMSHYLPNTGTTITTLNLSDVPFFPAVGLAQQNDDSNPSDDNASYSWLSSSSSYTMNKGTNATFIYSSYPALSSSNNNETPQITILLEDGTNTPCEKRPLPALGGVILIRPHFRSFIERLSTDRHYDTTLRIWTAAPQLYADQVLNSIGWHPSIKRFYQQHCAKFLLQRPLFAHRVPEGSNPSPLSSSLSKPSSFEVNDLNVGDMIYLKPISELFHLDGGKKWSPANTVLIDNAAYVGLQFGQKQILAPDFIAEPLGDYSLIAYWCQLLHHRYPAECGVALRSIGMDRLEDGIREGKIIIKRIIDDKWMEGKEGYNKIMKSIESLIQQPNNPADLDYFGKISFGEQLR